MWRPRDELLRDPVLRWGWYLVAGVIFFGLIWLALVYPGVLVLAVVIAAMGALAREDDE